MKPTDEEIDDVPIPDISDFDFEDEEQVAKSLPAYQEFIRDQRLNEV